MDKRDVLAVVLILFGVSGLTVGTVMAVGLGAGLAVGGIFVLALGVALGWQSTGGGE